MPLLDHFHSPLSQRRHWDSFHGAWAEAIARQLNDGLLPSRYVAEARVALGGQVEIDVATFDEGPTEAAAPSGDATVAVWAPPRPTATAALDFGALDLIEVQIFNEAEGPQLVGAVELVSPANKNRPSHRRMFAIKCAAYLQQGVGVCVIDVVTVRRANLHAELLKLLQSRAAVPATAASDLYATSYRALANGETTALEIWAEKLALGDALPTVPLWIASDLAVPLELEATYRAACAARRISVAE